jgi:SAM-dependent methyltransferase
MCNSQDSHLEILHVFQGDLAKAFLGNLDAGESVLEVGPSRRSDALNSPVFQRMPHLFFDSQTAASEGGLVYFSLDSDPSVGAQFTCDVYDADSLVPAGSLDAVLLLSVVEHIPDPFKLFQVLATLLKPGGRLLAVSPWNLRFHGPRPDCWRISDDGYRSLLSAKFENLCFTYAPCPLEPLHPVAVGVSAARRFEMDT